MMKITETVGEDAKRKGKKKKKKRNKSFMR